MCMQCFLWELKRLNQRQGAFLRHLECLNHPWYEAQSCSTKKVGFSKWDPFFDSMHFRPWPLPSGGFIQKIPHGHAFHLIRARTALYQYRAVLGLGKASLGKLRYVISKGL